MKKAITYYYDMLNRPTIRDIEIHSSGKAAVDYFIKNAGSYFSQPIYWKTKPKLSGKGALTAGFGHRKMVARFLSDEEVVIYEEYGDETWMNYETQTLIEPPANDSPKQVAMNSQKS